MSIIIPPEGKNARIRADIQAPQLKPEDYPLVILWQAEYRDGRHCRGICLVHSQAALNGLYRDLAIDQTVSKAQFSLKLMRCDELSVYPRLVRACDTMSHNQDIPHGNYCYECGRPTRIIRIVEDE